MKACREEGREGRSRCSRGLTPGLGPRPQCCAFVLLPPPLEGHSHLAAEDEARLPPPPPSFTSPLLPLMYTRTWQRKMRRACTSASVRLSVGASASAPGPRRLSCSPSTCRGGGASVCLRRGNYRGRGGGQVNR